MIYEMVLSQMRFGDKEKPKKPKNLINSIATSRKQVFRFCVIEKPKKPKNPI